MLGSDILVLVQRTLTELSGGGGWHSKLQYSLLPVLIGRYQHRVIKRKGWHVAAAVAGIERRTRNGDGRDGGESPVAHNDFALSVAGVA